MIRIHRIFHGCIFFFAGITGMAAQQPPTTQIASLRPDQSLLWRRVSPTAQQPDGPVLYQLVFRFVAHDSSLSGNGSLNSPLAIASGGVGTTQLAAGAVTLSKLGFGGASSGQTLVADGAGGASWQTSGVTGITAAGGLTVSGTGNITLSIANAGVTNAMLASNSVTNANIADGSLVPAKITGTAATLGANNFTGDQRVGSNLQFNAAKGSLFASSGGFADNSTSSILSVNQFGLARAIYATTLNNTDANPTIQGESRSSIGIGVVGINTDAAAGHSGGTGVEGSTESPSGFGVIGDAFFASGAAVGVEGRAGGSGVAGVFDNLGNGTILSGRVNGTEFFRVDASGVKSFMNGQTLVTGFVGCSTGFLGVAISSSSLNCTNYALVSNGSQTFLNVPTGGSMGFRINNNSQMTIDSTGTVHVLGTLTKAGGSFMIDHPLDPANKYLYHSFVESPDMMNIYNGVIVLDAKGEAVVSLPDWFGALNRDFRYQLTAIAAPGPNLYIADEISNNRFKIAGGTPGGKVSWQVTGIRQDAYANAHRIPVEQEKPNEEKGTYLHPELFGAPPEKGISNALGHGPTAHVASKR